LIKSLYCDNISSIKILSVLTVISLLGSGAAWAQNTYTSSFTNNTDADLSYVTNYGAGSFGSDIYMGTTANSSLQGLPGVMSSQISGATYSSGSLTYTYNFDQIMDGGNLALTWGPQRGDWEIAISGGNGTLSVATPISFSHGTTVGVEGVDFKHGFMGASGYFLDDISSNLGNFNLGFYGAFDVNGTYDTVTLTQKFSPDSEVNRHDPGVSLHLTNYQVPEPSALFSGLVGGLLLLGRRRR